jgi:perosamine synthetase
MKFTKLQKIYNIPVSEPVISKQEVKYVLDCLKSNWISSRGKYIRKFETHIKTLVKSKYALAVTNGTVAIELALKALGIQTGDEVIIPNLTFGATINAVINSGGVPVVLDIDKNNWTMKISDVKKKITNKTRFIIPVHLYGHPVDMKNLMKVLRNKNIKVIEDSAEALGSKIENKHVGVFGDVGTFSFYGNKLITTGEGGMIVTNKKYIYQRLKILRDHGMSIKKKYYHSMIGTNARMTNIQAAIGCAQMERFKYFYNKRKENFKLYTKILKKNKIIQFQKVEDWATSSYWLYTMLINNINLKNKITKNLKDIGIDTRPLFIPLNNIKIYNRYIKNRDENFPNSDYVNLHGISLPSSASLTNKEVTNICLEIIKIIKK